MIDPHRKTPDGRIIQGCGHTSLLLNHKERNAIVMKSVSELRGLDFDSIVCCGTSGLLVAPQVCEILNKNLIIIRKKNVKSYSSFVVEGVCPSTYVVLDDLVCSGATIKYIREIMFEEYTYAHCLGVYLYLDPREHSAYGEDIQYYFKKDTGLDLLNPL